MALDKARENHNGPKRGKGHWGKKKDAKYAARKTRRLADRTCEACYGPIDAEGGCGCDYPI